MSKSRNTMKLLIFIVVTASIASGIAFWNDNNPLERGEITRTVTFELEDCTYGYAVLKSDQRTPSVREWASIEGAGSDGMLLLSTDKNNPATIEIKVEIPENHDRGIKYLKAVYKDSHNKKQYEQTISFNA